MRKGIIFIVLIISAQLVFSQGFKGEIFGGLNASQIDGDDLGGYNKVGLAIGGGVYFPLKEDILFLGLQGMYNQKGASTKTDDPNMFIQRLTYIDMPVFISWNAYEDLFLSSGFVPGVLISAERDDGFGFESNMALCNTFSFDYMLEAKYYLLQNVAAGVRWNYAMLSSRTTKSWSNNLLGFYVYFEI